MAVLNLGALFNRASIQGEGENQYQLPRIYALLGDFEASCAKEDDFTDIKYSATQIGEVLFDFSLDPNFDKEELILINGRVLVRVTNYRELFDKQSKYNLIRIGNGDTYEFCQKEIETDTQTITIFLLPRAIAANPWSEKNKDEIRKIIDGSFYPGNYPDRRIAQSLNFNIKEF